MEKKRSNTGLKILKGILFLLNILALGLLLLAYAAYHTNPLDIRYIAFAGLAYPYILLLNIAFIVFWAITRIKYALVPLIVVLAGWNHIGRLVQWGGDGTEGEKPGQFKMMSYNLQNFLKLNTSSTKYVKDFKNEARIMDFMKEENADIVCLQEMLYDRGDNKTFTANLAAALGCAHYHYTNYYPKNSKKIDAIATFSRFPLVGKGDLEHEGKTIGIFTDLIIHGDTVRVYNLHLASIHFRQEDYQFWSDMASTPEQEKLAAGTGKILSKMDLAFQKRAVQAAILTTHFHGSPHPVIVCGDFNDTPSSYAYNALSQQKGDAFTAGGSGFGTTYAGEFFPAFRIDYILYGRSFTASGFKRHKVPYSDHFPVTTYLQGR